jgi:vacuolar protein sorting-associated protein 13A/C
MSRITGVLGKTLANLSMDEEYQRKRREHQQSRPTALHEGLMHSGKGLASVSATLFFSKMLKKC